MADITTGEVFVRRRSDRWGRYALYDAKIGTHPSAVVLVKRTRWFHVGQKIEFANIDDCRGMSKGSADSTNAVRNGNQVKRFGMYCPPASGARQGIIADRIEAHQSASVWVPMDEQACLVLAGTEHESVE